MWNAIWRKLTGHCWTHDKYPEDYGGTLINCCNNCPWTHPTPIHYGQIKNTKIVVLSFTGDFDKEDLDLVCQYLSITLVNHLQNKESTNAPLRNDDERK